MRRSSQNDDNRFYAFLPPNGSTSSRAPMIPSPNRNAHYQFYDPRLRSQHQLQQNLFEYQYSSTNPQRSLPSLYGSPRHQYHYPSSSSLINELSTISTNTISDLGEPISVFDEIQPLEHRRSTAIVPAAPLPSRYIPPDATRRPSATDVRLVTANVLREQLLTDIERTFDDIDRELTSLERRPSVPRYLPPRFSPIAEFDVRQHFVGKNLNQSVKFLFFRHNNINRSNQLDRERQRSNVQVFHREERFPLYHHQLYDNQYHNRQPIQQHKKEIVERANYGPINLNEFMR